MPSHVHAGLPSARAIRLHAPGSLEEVILPVLEREGDEVLVRVTHSSICGTDLKIFRGEIPVQYPRIMGHEMAGEVADAGSRSLAPGTRVLIDPMIYCGSCFQCQSGRTNLCPNGKLLGRDADGGFADYLLVPTKNLHPLPGSIPDLSAPVLQVLATCIHAQRLAQTPVPQSVAVLGLGVSGQLHAQLAKSRGASIVLGNSRSRLRRELAARFGVSAVVKFRDLLESVSAATSGRGVDLVVETTGISAALASAISICRPGGKILLFGINSSTRAELPFYQLYYKELGLLSARSATGEDFDAAIAAVNSGSVQLEPLITHRLPLDQLSTALAQIESGSEDRLKIVLEH